MSDKLGQFANKKYLNLESFRKSGKAVATPVWFAEAGGELFIYSLADAGKVKRIHNDARVLIAPSNVRGKPTGPAIRGTARIVPKDEWPHAEAALAEAYGLGRKLYERVFGGAANMGTYVEISPMDSP